MSYQAVIPWIRLASGLKYALLFAVVLLALPLSVFEWMLTFSMFGGVYLELDGWSVYWLAIGLFASAWSLMFCIGLLCDGLERRTSPGDLPPAATAFLGIPVTRGQMLLFTAAAAAQTLLVAGKADAPWWLALAAGGAGGLVTYVVMVLLSAPAHLLDKDFDPIPAGRLGRAIWRFIGRVPGVMWLVSTLHRILSYLFAALGLNGLLRDRSESGGRPYLLPSHFFAITNVSGLVAVLAVVGWLFFPAAPKLSMSLPAATYGYIFILLMIWIISSLDYHLSRLRISPLLALVAIMAVAFTISDADHYYDAELEQAASPVAVAAAALAAVTPAAVTPAAVAGASRSPENLVVVASAGGGILASGWTALALRNMLAERPRLADEIRLLSTVSGGSVGVAYYAAALRRSWEEQRPEAADALDLADALDEVFKDTTASSLDSTMYGFAFLDVWRILIGDSLPVLKRWDRGRLLEDSWQRIAGEEPSIFDLRPGILAGRVPAVIFNSTVMETGHRLMLTPVDFRDVPRNQRAATQSDLLTADGGEADLGLFVAARLSATFPYISPAARSNLDAGERPADVHPIGKAYHLVDGGYYDNFGITSALDWLEPVLAARLDALPPRPWAKTARSTEVAEEAAGQDPQRLTFRKVLIIQLSPFPPSTAAKPARGLLSALAGPLLGLFNIIDGVQVTRKEIDLGRALTSWRSRFQEAGADVCLKTVTFRPPPGTPPGPLSWHLTPSQIADLEASWPLDFAKAPAAIRDSWQEMVTFLEQSGCDGE